MCCRVMRLSALEFYCSFVICFPKLTRQNHTRSKAQNLYFKAKNIKQLVHFHPNYMGNGQFQTNFPDVTVNAEKAYSPQRPNWVTSKNKRPLFVLNRKKSRGRFCFIRLLASLEINANKVMEGLGEEFQFINYSKLLNKSAQK